MKNNIMDGLPISFEEAISGQVHQAPSNDALIGVAKSPLRYPGGKSRAVKAILEIMPQMLDSIVSPFFGGGSIEIALVNQGTRVYGYDAFKPLVLFWQALIEDRDRLADEVANYHPLSRDRFYEIQDLMKNERVKDNLLPVLFFVMNRSSFSGTTFSGGMSPNHERFTPSSWERLRNFETSGLLSVERLTFEDSLAKHKNDFIYADPPYANGGALYGQRGDCHVGFNHESLARILTGRDGWILSYNDCSLVRDLYEGFTVIPAAWSYGMNTDKKSNEILILSKDFKNYG